MKNKGLALFELFLLVVVAYFLVEATQYNSRARLVPILVGVPTLLLIAFQMAVDHIPVLERFRPARVQIVSMDREMPSRQKKAELSRSETLRREFTALAWVVGLGVALTLFGFYVVLPLFLFSFLRFVAGLGWLRSLLLAALAAALLYLSFVQLLGVSFYPGMIIQTIK